MSKAFADTNILIYAVSEDARAPIALDLLLNGCEISIQSLNEYVSVARRKFKNDWVEIDRALVMFEFLCPAIHPVTLPIHRSAIALAARHNFHIYDALIVAAALNADCDTLYSQDMQHGIRVADRLRIVNPFKTAAP